MVGNPDDAEVIAACAPITQELGKKIFPLNPWQKIGRVDYGAVWPVYAATA